jgi:hypothetical protein
MIATSSLSLLSSSSRRRIRRRILIRREKDQHEDKNEQSHTMRDTNMPIAAPKHDVSTR